MLDTSVSIQTPRLRKTIQKQYTTVSVVIPTFNEESDVIQCLDYLWNDCCPRPTEIIVCDGGSTDATLDLVCMRLDTNMHIQLVRLEKASRATAQNAGIQHARGDIVMFCHVDTRPPHDFVDSVVRTLQDDTVGMGAFETSIENEDGKIRRWITWHQYVKMYYTFLFYPRWAWKGMRAFLGDQCIFARRCNLLECGGFSDVSIMEESTLCKRLLKYGRGKLVRTPVGATPNARCRTSDRRIALYTNFQITCLHLFIGFGYELGVPITWLKRLYPPQSEMERRNMKQQIIGCKWYELDFLWQEIFERNMYDHSRLRDVARNTSVVVDVGANVGLFSLWFDRTYAVKGTMFYALEPNPALFPALTQNLHTFLRNKSSIHTIALGTTTQTSNFSIFDRATGWSSFTPDLIDLFSSGFQYLLNRYSRMFLIMFPLYVVWFAWVMLSLRRVRVPIQTLGEWMTEQGLQHIDILKLDVENHELSILSSISKEDWSKIRCILVETTMDHNEVVKLLVENGFDVSIKQDPMLLNTPYSLVVAIKENGVPS